ncbi:MAG: tetratricopeptide repeat protein [Bacteroidales bacterium]|nr:tetratricopeptide repeat protein [Bacteroidales bacterium]MDT8431410.1 tetratricopeptide repeat protein [Bacteroidales bacterium]
MFRTPNPRYFIPLFLVFFLISPRLTGQVPEHEVPELKQQAMTNFEEGDYASAGSAFTKLIRQFPRDAMYRYYAGICNVEQGTDLETAVELLYYASTRGVPEDVYYYLGEAYRKMYDFERAKKYYIAFDSEAPRSMARERDSRLLIRSINTAMQLTAAYNPYEVQNVTFINLYNPIQVEQIRTKGGSMTRKPDEFFTEDEDREELNAWMFLPKNPTRGAKVFFAGLERRGKEGFQIMQAERGNTGKWTNIQPVEHLNTAGDEILPYFDPVGKDLYFASDGREGLGGFDLYRSHYDEVRDEWSEPVSLGFPVNSAFDDYLLLPGTDLGMVTFFSARQTNEHSVAVFRVHLSEPKQSLASKSPQEIRRIANLDDAASEMMKEFEAYKDFLTLDQQEVGTVDQRNAKDGKPAQGSGMAARVNDRSVPGQDQMRSAQSADPDYQELISAALKHQAASDSLTELSTEARVRVRESDDPNEKWLSQRQIMVWEKKSSEAQEQADQYFAQIADYTKSATPSVIEKDTVIKDITVYRFAENTPSGPEGPSIPDVTGKVKTVFSGGSQKIHEQPVVRSDQQDTGATDREKNKVPSQQPVAGGDEARDNSAGTVHAPTGAAGQVTGSGNAKSPEGKASANQRFELLSAPPYTDSNPIPVDVPLPTGTHYRIQMGVYSGKVDPAIYGGISPVNAMTDPERNLVFYYAGSFRTYDEARDALDRVRSEGYADAFIVSWYNGAKMSVEKARKLE